MRITPVLRALPQQPNKRRGAALVLAALLCLVLVPIVGLVVDGASAFLMRTEVSTALDASVLAGARSLNTGQDIASQAANATSVAQNVFNANVSSMNWKFKTITSTISVGQNDVTHYRWVTATANADLPLTMMKMIGFSTTHISMTATAQRRDVNVVLVLDHSGSMKPAMSAMIAAATNFTNMFSGGRDKVGMVAFDFASFVAYPPSVNFKSASPNVTTFIGQLVSYGNTNTAQALWAAWLELQKLNQPGALNVIVVFTDGMANTYAADFAPYIVKTAGCSGLANPLTGVIAGGGTVSGLTDPTALSLNDQAGSRTAPNSSGCPWLIGPTTNLRQYLSGLPAQDINGNATNGTGAYLPVNLTAAGISNSKSANLNVTNSGINAFDAAANNIRNDKTLTPLIYAIGLGSNGGVDSTLLARVANDPSSSSFHPNQPAGLYVFSPTPAQLQSAFLRIASEILRLSQ
jgi:Mg-chelatase subunit ChlD